MSKLKDCLKMFLSFFKIGLFTFGGGYAMISLFQSEFVEKKKIITDDEFIKLVAIAESTPGPIAINGATYIGYKKCGILGSIFATLGVCLPSFIIIYIISLFLDDFMKYSIVQKAFGGISCGVGVLILSAGIKLFKKMKLNAVSVILLTLTVITLLIIDIFALNFSTIILIIIGMVVGIVVTALSKKEQVTK